jgi:PAS domain S-box-containing protein
MDTLRLVLYFDGFMPHGFCFLWNAKLLWLHALSDSLIFAAYLSIPFALIYLARQRRDLPYRWMFWLFGAFIVSCGFSHGMDVWTLWHPNYWISGAIKAVTAVVSVATAILLVKLVRRPLALLTFEAATPGTTGLRPGLGNRPLWLAYGLGFVAVAATLLVIEAAGLEAATNAPVVVFILPIVLSAYVGGLAPGLVSTASATLVSIYFMLPPTHAWRVTNPVDNTKWISLSAAGVLISVLMADRERSRVKEASSQVRGLLLSTERKVRAGFAFLLACLVAIAIVSYPTLVRLREDNGWVEHSHEVIAMLQLVLASATDAEACERGYIITGRENELVSYQSATEHVGDALRKLRRVTADNPLEQRRLIVLEPVVAERMMVLQDGIKSRRKGFRQAKAVVSSGRAEQLQERIGAIVTDMETTEQNLLAAREVRARRASTAARVVVVGGSALAVVIVGAGLLVIGAAFSASRRAEESLQESKDELEARVKERTSELAQANESLRASEKQFRTLANAIPTLCWMANSDGWIFWYNQRWYEYTGTTPEEMEGWGWQSVHDPDVLPKVLESWKTSIATGEPFEMVFPLRGADGIFHPFLTRVTPLLDEEGKIARWFGTNTDISELQKTQEALRQRTQELERSNADLEHFAYVASHDLQEPLRMVASFTQLLAKRYEGKLDSDADQFIGYAVEGAGRMQMLISDLLAYSRVGTRGNEFAPTSCETVLEIVLTNLKTAIEEAGALVTHDPLPTVMADQGQLCQVFQNLLANALKFHGSTPPHVHVSAERGEDEWRFSVRDNGIGIDPQDAERIFVIFERLHTSAEFPGTGIGLAISKKVVERHGGRIGVESEPGAGATFYFTIPKDKHTVSGVK